MKKNSRTTSFLFFSGVALATTILVSSCNDNGSANHEMDMTPEVHTASIIEGDAETLKQYTASLEGIVNIEVRAQASGYITKIVAEEGSYVKKGQTILLIDAQPYQIKLNNASASLKAAKAALASARIERDKVAELLKNSFVSAIQLQSAEAVLDSAKANVAQAEAAVAEAQVNLNFCTIKAPVDGYLGRINKRIGNLVSLSDVDALTTLSDITSMYAYFSISEADYFNLIQGDNTVEQALKVPVDLELSNGEKYPLAGKIDMVNGEFDAATNSINVRAVFPNPNLLLRNGGTGIVNLVSIHEKAIQVPMDATVDIQDKIFAYVVGQDNKVEQRQLKIIGKNLHTYFISAGVKPGELLVTTSVDKLQDGMVIKPAEKSQTSKETTTAKEATTKE